MQRVVVCRPQRGTLMTRSFVFAALVGTLVALTSSRPVAAEEPKATGTVDITSSVPDLDKLRAFGGTGVILDQKEWEKLAAAWGYKDPPRVDFSKELLLVGTWRGANFKFLANVKNGDLTVELVGDKDVQPGFRYKVMSLERAGITKFQGKDLPPAAKSEVQPIKEKPTLELSGELSDRALESNVPENGIITTQKEWDVVVEKWRLKDVPKVDFTKEILIVGSSRSTTFDLTHVVKNGNLTITNTGVKDTREGFRWRVLSVKREGIKTVQGKELP